MSERFAYWAFGFVLAASTTVAIGRNLVAEHGRRIVPGLALLAIVAGLLFGWAIDGYIQYVRASAQRF
ncbi:MAG TPA: hypothetical protein VHX17_06765 [Candidatus Cybelea sp.]|nr:hypothetical protein [Candidatus Cybelea sp.]